MSVRIEMIVKIKGVWVIGKEVTIKRMDKSMNMKMKKMQRRIIDKANKYD